MASAPLLADLGLDQGAASPGGGVQISAIVVAVAGALLLGGLIWAAAGPVPALGFVGGVGLIGGGATAFLARRTDARPLALEPDWTLVRAAAGDGGNAFAVTDSTGRVRASNGRFRGLFGHRNPVEGAEGGEASAALEAGARAALRDGAARVGGIVQGGLELTATIERSGRGGDHLVWRFESDGGTDLVADAEALLAGPPGERLGEAGVMAVLLLAGGGVKAANRVFRMRATGRPDTPMGGRDLGTLLALDNEGRVRFVREGPGAEPLRLVQVPLDPANPDGALIVILLDEDAARPAEDGDRGVEAQTLLAMLPFGLALTDRDGRFLFVNDAFARAGGIGAAPPVYPSDLVVREDKAAVSDAVRRFASGGGTLSADISIHLKDKPGEPVVMSIAAARGLGDAAVLLSLKDNSEESRLKRQVAQATKMQAVGQLAGGVAHDFNNILTAILGHCDLMLMRHAPGDSDYDDIQQIRANSNRAASLTRQLLAFSRQQTLRPQIIQLPDSVSDVFALLKRLVGESIELSVKHGRALGAVRADPGQLEQVIVNLVVNARDAIHATGRPGTVTLQTYALPAAEVRRMSSDILPIADYTALSVGDTGTGIPPDVLGKIFEPFFTTKEVGKGTGLGLSTVYGIVKQSGGYIFAQSELGQGTCFVMYLPVHKAEPVVAIAPPKEKGRAAELWGSGTILLVEDEDMVRAVAERALTRHGYRVLTAAHGEEALELLESGEKIDLLISDVMMPTMDGPTLVRHARRQMPDLPILFMSGYAEEQLRKSINIDRVQFLPKPFSVQQLAEAARDTLASS